MDRHYTWFSVVYPRAVLAVLMSPDAVNHTLSASCVDTCEPLHMQSIDDSVVAMERERARVSGVEIKCQTQQSRVAPS